MCPVSCNVLWSPSYGMVQAILTLLGLLNSFLYNLLNSFQSYPLKIKLDYITSLLRNHSKWFPVSRGVQANMPTVACETVRDLALRHLSDNLPTHLTDQCFSSSVPGPHQACPGPSYLLVQCSFKIFPKRISLRISVKYHQVILFYLGYNCFTMLLVSAVQQCESAVYPLPFEPPSHSPWSYF